MDKATPTRDGAPSAVAAVLVVVAIAIAALLVWPQSLGSGGAGVSQSSESSAASATGEVTRVTVTVKGMSFVPGVIEVPAGNTLEVTFTNTGDQRHDLAFANGVHTDPLAPGGTQSVTVGPITTGLDGWCTLPGHRQMGMALRVVPVGAAGSASNDGGAPTGGMADRMGHTAPGTTDSASTPTADQLKSEAAKALPYPAELAPLDGGGAGPTRHEYTFTVTEDQQALAEGVVRPLWTYNGTSPGPTLHGRVGDTFHITLVNAGTMGHSVDFHAGEVSPDLPMRTIEPGETLEYDFTANRSGIWMYHCSTMPMSLHIANGMFGAVVIEPDDLPPVDRSYVLVQSDLYLGDDTASGAPDLMAFNGRPFQYDVHPLQAKAGDRVRFWVLDAGPNSDLAFHIVGGQFDTVWTEGHYSVYRGQSTDGVTVGTTGAQVLPLMAAQGGFVEIVPQDPGHYALVNHVMSLAEKGAHGTLEVSP